MTPQRDDRDLERVLRDATPVVLAALTRRYERFDLCEDAVQAALFAASTQWPVQGVPANPEGWLITAASRRWIEYWRNESARQQRELRFNVDDPRDAPPISESDDSLTLLFLCCHPALTPPSQVALTLRAVAGLSTSEIARGLLVPEATVAQRISRAKNRIRDSGARFRMPDPTDRPTRMAAVLKVLYLIFNEGHTATHGAQLQRLELTGEAIRLARQLHSEAPDEGEAAGLLALMLLTDARRSARTTDTGTLVPLTEQDRTLWDQEQLAEGRALLDATLPTSTIGPYQVQAAIAAVHADAPTADATDWRQILGLYDVLVTMTPTATVTLNRVVAVGMVHGPEAGLLALTAARGVLGDHVRVPAVRAHLLEMAGRVEEAREDYRTAARRTLNVPEREYLERRARDL